MTAFGAARFVRAARGKLPGTSEGFPPIPIGREELHSTKSPARFLKGNEAEGVLSMLV